MCTGRQIEDFTARSIPSTFRTEFRDAFYTHGDVWLHRSVCGVHGRRDEV